MDNLDLGSLNYWAILVAVVFNQALGAAWYSGRLRVHRHDRGQRRRTT